MSHTILLWTFVLGAARSSHHGLRFGTEQTFAGQRHSLDQPTSYLLRVRLGFVHLHPERSLPHQPLQRRNSG